MANPQPVAQEQTPEAPTPVVPIRPVQRPKLHFGRLLDVDHDRGPTKCAKIPAGTTIETLLEPTYLAHFASMLTPGMIIEAKCEDGSWFGWFWVMFVAADEVKLEELWSKTISTSEGSEEDSDTHMVKWVGPVNKYAVVRRDTGSVIKDKLFPKSEAHAFLRNHLRKLED